MNSTHMNYLSAYRLGCNSDMSVYFQIKSGQNYLKLDGTPRLKNWTKPELNVFGVSKKPREFVLFEDPCISDRAKVELEQLIGPYVEFLPLATFKKVDYWVINVLCVQDCIDYSKPVKGIGLLPNGLPESVVACTLDPKKLPSSPIFKIRPTEAVFVTPEFVEIVVSKMLTNAKFSDPEIATMYYEYRNIDTNLVPYLAR